MYEGSESIWLIVRYDYKAGLDLYWVDAANRKK